MNYTNIVSMLNSSDKSRLYHSIWSIICLLFLAVWERPAAGGDEGRLSDIIENVQAGENRYNNYEVMFEYNYKVGTPPFLLPGSDLSENISVTFVKQGDYFYFKQNGEKRVNDNRDIKFFSEAGYDGQSTRVNENNSFGNMADHRRMDPRGYLPHAVMYRPWVGSPLSVYLKGGEVLKADPAAGRYSSDLELKCSYLAKEQVDGQLCFKIKIEHSSAAGKVGFGLLWIAPEKNYLPVRLEEYDNINPRLPISIRRVEEFKKCDDGLEYPSHVSYKNYDRFSLSKENQVLVGSWDLVVKDIKIGVNYPKSYFSNIEFAPKRPVYVIENRKISNTFLPETSQRERLANLSFVSRNKYKILIFINFLALSIYIVASLVKRRKKNRMAKAPESGRK